MKHWKKILFAFLLSCNTQVLSWSSPNHAVIAQIAYDNLSPKDQKTVDQLAQNFFDQLPEYLQRSVQKRFKNASLFAALSTMPDYTEMRHIPLHETYRQHNAKIPDNLLELKDRTTSHWHFTNESDDKGKKEKNVMPI